MNIKYKDSPEIISSTRSVDEDGDETFYGDRVTGIQVIEEKGVAMAQIDLRGFDKKGDLVIEIELAELVSALSLATFNATKD